jgi:hypothetical protein
MARIERRIQMKGRSPFLAVVILILAVPAAFADPVIITGGSMSVASPSLGYDPPFPVRLTGEHTQIWGITYDFAPDSVNIGDVVHLSRTTNVTFRYGYSPLDQTVDGIELTDAVVRGTLHFVAPPATFTGDARGLRVPFTMDGVLSFFRHDFRDSDELLLTTTVRGSGTTSMGTRPLADFFRVTFVTYAFEPVPPAPVPEPGTLALFGSGLVVALRGLRRIRS